MLDVGTLDTRRLKFEGSTLGTQLGRGLPVGGGVVICGQVRP